MKRMVRTISDLSSNIWSGLAGLFSAFLGFFIPVKDIVHLMVVFFIIDVGVGYWAARKIRGEKFSTPIIWNTTIPRMVLSITVVLLSFAWDKIFGQEMIQTYKVVGWFVSGILLFSIVKNAYKITKWKVFPQVGDILKERLKIKDDDTDGEL